MQKISFQWTLYLFGNVRKIISSFRFLSFVASFTVEGELFKEKRCGYISTLLILLRKPTPKMCTFWRRHILSNVVRQIRLIQYPFRCNQLILGFCSLRFQPPYIFPTYSGNISYCSLGTRLAKICTLFDPFALSYLILWIIQQASRLQTVLCRDITVLCWRNSRLQCKRISWVVDKTATPCDVSVWSLEKRQMTVLEYVVKSYDAWLLILEEQVLILPGTRSEINFNTWCRLDLLYQRVWRMIPRPAYVVRNKG